VRRAGIIVGEIKDMKNEGKQAMLIKASHLRWVLISIALITVGCGQKSSSVKWDSTIERLSKGMEDKTSAAAVLQSTIRGSNSISVRHKGYKPHVRPPCPAPDWTPRETLIVDEDRLCTKYQRQHWIEEKEERKVGSPIFTGFTREFYSWSAFKGPTTNHDFEMRFEDIFRVDVDKPLFGNWIQLDVFYNDTSNADGPDTSKMNAFRIWFLKSGSKPHEYK
jgi:hypothetical protein